MVKVTIIAFLITLVVGGWFGRKSSLPPAATEAPPSLARSAAKMEPRWSSEDIHSRALEVVLRYQQPGYDSMAALFIDWTDEEIHAALDAGLKDPEYVLDGGSGGGTMDALFGEWMKRDLEAAIEWFETIEIEAAQNRMALGLSYRWPAEHAELGLEFVLAHKDIFVRGSPWSILTKNFEASARSGPEALGRLLEHISGEGLSLEFANSSQLPESFDFSTFVTTKGFELTMDTPAVATLLSNWMIQDRDAAFDWFIENKRAANLVNAIPHERKTALEHWEWLGTRLDTLDDENRKELLDTLEPGWQRDHRAGAHFAKGIKDPVLREHLHEIGARAILRGSVVPALESLEQIEDPARRIEILTEMNRSDVPFSDAFRQPIGATDAAMLRDKLTAWQATEAQIDEILRKLKP